MVVLVSDVELDLGRLHPSSRRTRVADLVVVVDFDERQRRVVRCFWPRRNYKLREDLRRVLRGMIRRELLHVKPRRVSRRVGRANVQ